MASLRINHDFLDPPKDSEDHLGTLGHYRVLSELGKGGMGYVFLAEDVRLKRQVALKVMNQKIAGTPGSRKRFISEARSMAAVHHDNVATIFEVGEHKGTPFMAMELLEGSTLENYRERHGEPDYHQLIAYARDIARGLAAAHAQGIVHRDIKPANIWLDTKTNRIKILDFGLALASTPVDQLSGRGAVVGTPGYLSPEQARSEPLDDRCDLYCAGVVLYEMATGSLPLKTKTVAEQLIAILAHAPKPLRERNDKIPQPLADLIHRLMAKEPRNRYSSAAELEKALDEVEIECEKKSEVAQAISQLQLGLEQAVNKKNRGVDDALDLGNSEQAPPNPFESLPDALPAAVPLATGVSSSGVHAAIPMAAATPAASPRPAPTKTASNSKIIWIAVGVCAAVLLVAIPAIVFLSDSSAIARQQNQSATVITAGSDNNPNAANSNSPSSQQSQKPPQQRPQQNQQPKQQPTKTASPTPDASTLITKVNAKEVQGVGGQGAKWLLGLKQANGSFEEGASENGQLKIPGWTAKVTGNNAGWDHLPNARNEDARTFAFAGPKSELVLTSDVLDHTTKAGDTFRLSMNTGGTGPGVTDYRIILGFQGNSGPPVRYQLAEFSNDAKWTGGGQAKVIYEYAVDASAENKRPFVELTIANKNPTRKRGMLDRVILTVRAKQKAPAKPADNRSTPIAQPATKTNSEKTPAESAMASADKPKPTPAQPESKAPPAKASPATRVVAITTADEFGADASVSKSRLVEVFGEKPTLVVQTRNDAQIQHAYLRFPLLSVQGDGARGGANNRRKAGGQNEKQLPVVTAELKLQLVDSPRPGEATMRVYGISDAVSDVWPENKIAWGNSFSSEGLEKFPLLAEHKIGRNDKTISISNDTLAEFVAKANHRSVTLILTGSSGNELFTIASKEDVGIEPPALILGLKE